MRAYSECIDGDLLDAFLDVYNRWILSIASAAPHRLRAVVLLNVDDPRTTARAMRRMAKLGAAGFALPLAPGEGYRYDQPRYEVLWRSAAELRRPLSLLAGAHRGHNEEKVGAEERHHTLAAQLAFNATSVFPARRSITAIIYAGVFERCPELHIGVIGFGVGWAAYAIVRADEMYEVRPERTGPPTRVSQQIDEHSAARYLRQQVGVAIAGDDRSGTVGMAPEGVGYHFAPGERFSDHFRRNVFLTFDDDSLGIGLRRFLGIEGMLWGHRLGDFHDADSTVIRNSLDKRLAGVSEDCRRRLVSANTARIYSLDRIASSRTSVSLTTTHPRLPT
jgi:hypothetical protein